MEKEKSERRRGERRGRDRKNNGMAIVLHLVVVVVVMNMTVYVPRKPTVHNTNVYYTQSCTSKASSIGYHRKRILVKFLSHETRIYSINFTSCTIYIYYDIVYTLSTV